MIAGFWPQFMALLIGHALADYPLQGDCMARDKNHKLHASEFVRRALGNPPAHLFILVWPWALFYHALIHAGFVWALTGDFFLGLLELVFHILIDYLTSDGRIGFHSDQFLHSACKLAWTAMI